MLNPVESYLEDYARLDHSHPAMREFLKRMGLKPLGHLGDFHVGQSRISLADVEQLIIIFPTDARQRCNRKARLRRLPCPSSTDVTTTSSVANARFSLSIRARGGPVCRTTRDL